MSSTPCRLRCCVLCSHSLVDITYCIFMGEGQASILLFRHRKGLVGWCLGKILITTNSGMDHTKRSVRACTRKADLLGGQSGPRPTLGIFVWSVYHGRTEDRAERKIRRTPQKALQLVPESPLTNQSTTALHPQFPTALSRFYSLQQHASLVTRCCCTP